MYRITFGSVDVQFINFWGNNASNRFTISRKRSSINTSPIAAICPITLTHYSAASPNKPITYHRSHITWFRMSRLISYIPYKITHLTVRVTVRGKEIPPTVSSLKGKNASLNFECSQNIYISRVVCYVPASIAVVIPRRLSGVSWNLFKGLGFSQHFAFCPQKAMLAGIMYLLSANYHRMWLPVFAYLIFFVLSPDSIKEYAIIFPHKIPRRNC